MAVTTTSRQVLAFVALASALLIAGLVVPRVNHAQARWLTGITVTPADSTIGVGQTQAFSGQGSFSDGSTGLLSTGGATWAGTGALATPRFYHTATLLQDGTVLVVGGYNSSSSFASAERYFPASGTWAPAGSLSAARLSHTATLLPSGKVLVVGGIRYPDNTLFNTTQLYDPLTNSWTTAAPLTLGVRAGHSAVLLGNGKVLVVAGLQSYPDCTYRATAELYDPALNTWAATGSLHLARSSATATLLADGKVLLAAGPANGCPTPNNGLNQAEVYDPASGTWTVTGTMSVPRYNNTITRLPSGKVLLAGGYSTGTPSANAATASADLFNPATGTFSLTGALPAARATTGGTGDNGDTPLLHSGQVLVVGGSNSAGAPLSSAVLFDPASATWAATGSLTTPRQFNTTTILQDGHVLVAGGLGSGNTTLASAEVYSPQVTWTSSNTSVATIDQTGLATGLSTGTTTITVTSGSISGSTTLTVGTDTVAPTTSATFPAPNANGWNRLNVNVTLDALDSGGALPPSGVESITYTLTGVQTGGGTFHSNNTSFTITQEGTTTVTYYAIDNKGNVEAGHVLTINLDKTQPALSAFPSITVIATSAAGAVVTFSPVMADSLSGVDTVLVTQGLASGSTFPHGTTNEQVTVTDHAGNSTSGSFSVTVDKALVSIGVSPSAVTLTQAQTSQQFTATGTFTDGSTAGLTAGGGTWTASGSLATPRFYHTATRLSDGSVLVVGGYNGSSTFASAERYYPATGTWASAGSMLKARLSHTATLLPNGKVLVAGGIQYFGSAGTLTNTTELYDPITNSWAAGPPLTLGVRSSHSAVLLGNGKVLVVAGLQSYPDCTYRATAELYNPATNTWTATGSLALARSSATTTLLANGKVLLAGGPANNCPTPNSGLNEAEVYDPVSGTWAVTGTLSLPRFNNSITRLPNGKVLLAGGYTSTGTIATADVFNPATGSFSLTSSLATARAASGGSGDNGDSPLLQSGQVLFAGGYTSAGVVLGNSELYDPASGTWTTTGSLITPRTFNTATLLQDGHVLVVGGYTNGGGIPLGSAELYAPPGLSWASSNASVAAINQNGLATAVSTGTATMTASFGTVSGTASVTVDTGAPTTIATSSPAPNAAGWNNTNVTVALNATDDAGGTGVQSIVWSVNGGLNGGPFTVAGNSASASLLNEGATGSTTLNYHAIDNSGNVESDHALVVKIDKTAPFISYPSQVQVQATSSAGASVTFSVSASDGLSGLAGPVAVSPLASGATFPVGTTHETVTVTDVAGNTTIQRFDVIVHPSRPNIHVLGGNFDADGTPHPATATASDSFGTPVSGNFSLTYLPGGALAPVVTGQYSAAASFTSLDPAFTSAFPWTTMALDPDPKSSPAVAVIAGQLYVQGFHQDASGNQGSFAPRLSIYDPPTNTWATAPPPGIIRAYANAVAFHSKMYVVGGCVMSDCSSPTNALEIYDSATFTWSNGAPMPTARFGTVAGVIGDKLYVTGGSLSGYIPTTATEIYDFTTNTWTTGVPIPVSRELAAGAVVNSELYVIGGYQRGGVNAPVARVDVFNPATGWTTRPSLPTARWGAAAGVFNPYLIHVVGGWGAGGALLGTNERFDAFANTWLGFAPMPTTRTYASAGVVGSTVYVVDGFNGSSQSSLTEAFDSSLTTVITVHDGTAPVTTATPFPAPNGAGWNNTSVTVTLNATDEAGGSGVQSIVYAYNGQQNGGPFNVAGASASTTFSVDGTTTINYHAIDNSGNAEGDHALSIHIDQLPPNVFYPMQGVQANATSPSGAVVTFSVSASDFLSGLVGGTTISTTFNGLPVAPALQSGMTFPVGTTTETVTATDAAGNIRTVSFNVVVSPYDVTPPTTNASFPAPNANGWNRFNVNVNLNAFDSGGSAAPSGVRSITYSLSGAQTGGGTFMTSSTSFTISNEGTTTVVYHATDNNGKVESDHTLTIMLDKTQPSAANLVNLTVQATSSAGAVVFFDPAPSDALSGISGLSFTQGLPSGSTFPHGTTNENLTITDRAGNTAFRSFSVTVNKTLLSIVVSPATATVSVGHDQPFQATGHFTSGPDQFLPTGSSGGGSSGGSGGSGGGFGQAWQIQFPLAEALNVGACANTPTAFTSQSFSASTGSGPGMFGTVSTSWGNPSVVQVGGTVTAQDVHLTLSCIPSNGSTGTIDASWTGTRFEGTWQFGGGSGHTTILGWSTKAPLSAPRFSLGAAAVNGLVYAMGGGNPSQPSPVEAYNPATNSWSTVTQLPVSSEGPGVVALGGIIYAAGGHVAGGIASGVLQAYNPADGTWASGLAPMPTPRAYPALVAAGGKLYAIGGSTGSGSSTPTPVVEQYDPATNQWITRAPMSTPRVFHVAGALNSDTTIVAAGGNGSSTELYNVAGNAWTSGPDMVSTLGSPGGAVVNNALFVFGAGGGVQMFRPVGTQPSGWAGLAPMPTSRGQLGVAAVGDVVYAVGGMLAGGAGATATVEAFSTPLPSNFQVSSGGGGGGGGGSSSLPTVSWQSSNQSVAGINGQGFASGNAAGQTTITATDAGVSCVTTNTCATLTVIEPGRLTFTLAPGSAVFPSVELVIIDPSTGIVVNGPFDVSFGETQSINDENAFRLRFTAPIGYTVTPATIDLTVHRGDNITVPLFFALIDTTPPSLTVPSSQTTEATSPAGAVMTFANPTATDSGSGVQSVSCDHATGATFPLGTTTVHCSATDNGGNTASGSFDLTVVDATRPALTLPANITVDAASPAGAVVTYTKSATDIVSGPVAVNCVLPAGSTFPIGTSTVACTATDGAGNTASGGFQVLVQAAAAQVANLAILVQNFNLVQGIANSLDGKLKNILDALNAAQNGGVANVCDKLGAFINETQAQSGKQLTPNQANQLIVAATRIKAVVGCQ